MNKPKAWILAILLAGAPLLAPSARAADKIGQLLYLFEIRDLSASAVQNLIVAPGLQQSADPQQRCFANAITVDALVVEMRVKFTAIFSDPTVADATIAFMESPAGSKFSNFKMHGDADYTLPDLSRVLTPAEQQEVAAFGNSRAGSAFSSTIEGLEPMLLDSMNLVAGRAACGSAAAH